MPTDYVDTLQRDYTESRSRVGEAQGKVQDFLSSYDKVKGGNLADLQVSDSALQATLDEHDTNIRRLSGTVAGQTDQYQAAAQGAYRLGARGGRRLLGEARQQISLDLERLNIEARQRRVDAINTHRRLLTEDLQNERAYSLQLGTTLYNTKAAEEERQNRRKALYTDDFTKQILAGKPISDELKQELIDSGHFSTEDVDLIEQQAGSNALLQVRELAAQEGVPLNEADIDYTSDASAVASVQRLLAEGRTRRREQEDEANAREEQKLDLAERADDRANIALEDDIRRGARQDAREDARLAIEKEDFELKKSATKDAGCSKLDSVGERNKCEADALTKALFEQMPARSQGDPLSVALVGSIALNEATTTPEQGAANLAEYKTNYLAILNRFNPENADAREYLGFIARTYTQIPGIQEAFDAGDYQGVKDAISEAVRSTSESAAEVVDALAQRWSEYDRLFDAREQRDYSQRFFESSDPKDVPRERDPIPTAPSSGATQLYTPINPPQEVPPTSVAPQRGVPLPSSQPNPYLSPFNYKNSRLPFGELPFDYRG